MFSPDKPLGNVGSVTHEDRQSLLERAKRERKERQQIQQSQSAASRIQSWYRRLRHRRLALRSVRDEWNRLLAKQLVVSEGSFVGMRSV